MLVGANTPAYFMCRGAFLMGNKSLLNLTPGRHGQVDRQDDQCKFTLFIKKVLLLETTTHSAFTTF